MKRALVISPYAFLPVTAGNCARCYDTVRRLEDYGYEVSYCYVDLHRFCRDKVDTSLMQAYLGKRFRAVSHGGGPLSILDRIWSILRAHWPWMLRLLETGLRLRGRLFQPVRGEEVYQSPIDGWYPQSLSRFLNSLPVQPEVVICVSVFVSKAFESVADSSLKILDTVDVFSNRHRLFSAKGLTPQWYSTTEDEEAKGLSRADVILAIQTKEQRFFEGLCSRPVITVPHRVDCSAAERPGKTQQMLFVGSANSHNVEGVRSFIRDILPKIRSQNRHAELVLVGQIGARFQGEEGVLSLGALPSLESVFQQTSVVINPVNFGTGQPIKVIEALGQGKALVTCPYGTVDLEEWAGQAYLVAESDTEFADIVLELLADCKRRAELGREALSCAKAWNKQADLGWDQALAFSRHSVPHSSDE
jgi:glycosyltransferase involved in cell wall biosynthesis